MNALRMFGAAALLILLVAGNGSFAFEKPGGMGASIAPVQKYRAPQIQSADVAVDLTASTLVSLPSALTADPTLRWSLGRLAPLPELDRLEHVDGAFYPGRGKWTILNPLPSYDRLAPLPELFRLEHVDGAFYPGRGKWTILNPLPSYDRLAPLPELFRLEHVDGAFYPGRGKWTILNPLPSYDRLAPLPELFRLEHVDGAFYPGRGKWTILNPLPSYDRLAPLPELDRIAIDDGIIIATGRFAPTMPLPLPLYY